MIAVSEGIRRVTDRLVGDFQRSANRWWNERDLHWALFHYLKQEKVVEEEHITQLIRAEFPTVKEFGQKNPARGHYDLVVLDAASLNAPGVRDISMSAPWQSFLDQVTISTAVEIKLWQARASLEQRADRVGWDIEKLTAEPNNVQEACFLHFVHLDFTRPQMREWYQDLRRYLRDRAESRPDLQILCVPSYVEVQPDHLDDWL